MGINRGYNLNRGKGLRRNGSKRGECPKCGKRGMTQRRPLPSGIRAALESHCQFCGHSAVEYV